MCYAAYHTGTTCYWYRRTVPTTSTCNSRIRHVRTQRSALPLSNAPQCRINCTASLGAVDHRALAPVELLGPSAPSRCLPLLHACYQTSSRRLDRSAGIRRLDPRRARARAVERERDPGPTLSDWSSKRGRNTPNNLMARCEHGISTRAAVWAACHPRGTAEPRSIKDQGACHVQIKSMSITSTTVEPMTNI